MHGSRSTQGSFALLLVQFVLIVILSAVLYAGGESWAAWVRRFARRLADQQGDRMVVLAGQAIRGVALGVVVTALVQSILGGIGLAIAGVPFAAVLTAIMFALCIAQLGPDPGAARRRPSGSTCSLGAGWGTFMLVWSLVVGLMDNFLRPVLIKRGADLPLLLIFAGVIGGLVSLRRRRHIRRAGRAGGRLHAARRLGGRRRPDGAGHRRGSRNRAMNAMRCVTRSRIQTMYSN